MTRHISATDTTKLIRAALKEAYPETRFSVRTDHGRTSAAARITWTDGPVQDDVEKIVKPFESSTFDAMADIKGVRDGNLDGETVCFGTDHVFCDREQSEALVSAVAATIEQDGRTDRVIVCQGRGRACASMIVPGDCFTFRVSRRNGYESIGFACSRDCAARSQARHTDPAKIAVLAAP